MGDLTLWECSQAPPLSHYSSYLTDRQSDVSLHPTTAPKHRSLELSPFGPLGKASKVGIRIGSLEGDGWMVNLGAVSMCCRLRRRVGLVECGVVDSRAALGRVWVGDDYVTGPAVELRRHGDDLMGAWGYVLKATAGNAQVSLK